MNMCRKIKQLLVLFIVLNIYTLPITSSSVSFNDGMYFATASDTEHFPWLQGLITSILKYNYKKVAKIAVFNLGLTQAEIDILNDMAFVEVYDIDAVNADLHTKFVVRANGRLARGWYTWKPAVLYQSLKIFPYVLYLDSGIEVVAPLDEVFHEIKEFSYYLFDCGHLILPMVTERIMNLFELHASENKWILEEDGISAGIQGLSRELLEPYVVPVYNLAADIRNFEDDGSAVWGFGGARHDQALFSIFARKLRFKTHRLFCNPKKIRIGDSKRYFGLFKHFKLRKHKEKDPHVLSHARLHKLL